MNDHRIAQTSVTPTIARQTPKQDFGDMMSHGVSVAAGLISSVAPFASPILSTAVSALKSVSSGVTSVGGSAGSVASTGGELGGLGGGGSTQDLLQQIASGDTGASNAAYLQLQMRMQAESQQFQAVSNIMKVRSDSAKAAINNIR
jgi:hypothetical protein